MFKEAQQHSLIKKWRNNTEKYRKNLMKKEKKVKAAIKG